MKIVSQTDIDAYPLVARGKVRDVYQIDERSLLIVTTDRMSAFDVVLDKPIPYKGVILNLLTLFWMRKFDAIIPNHVLEADVDNFPQKLAPWKDELDGRAIIARKADPLPAEFIVRGYITGSGWKDYQKSGEICGHKLPSGMKEAQKLSPPLFTPSTKANLGSHDENIDFARMAALVGDETAAAARLVCLDLYEAGSAYAFERDIIVADTKFELGYIDGSLHLIDEVLTPDSSRFWPREGYVPGKAQPSFDKQYLRDWLAAQTWNKRAPAPPLPAKVVEETEKRYREAFRALTGETLEDAAASLRAKTH